MASISTASASKRVALVSDPASAPSRVVRMITTRALLMLTRRRSSRLRGEPSTKVTLSTEAGWINGQGAWGWRITIGRVLRYPPSCMRMPSAKKRSQSHMSLEPSKGVQQQTRTCSEALGSMAVMASVGIPADSMILDLGESDADLAESAFFSNVTTFLGDVGILDIVKTALIDFSSVVLSTGGTGVMDLSEDSDGTGVDEVIVAAVSSNFTLTSVLACSASAAAFAAAAVIESLGDIRPLA
mmetsp:Transcript_30574/g.49471  ORF Transcript_30574/g.49471 Transcript_30574/m.49471 type:complete len:242 (+) Transcript_30574:590-1315(+)